MDPLPSDRSSPGDACAPCGPECRYARELKGWPDYVWCVLRGAPHSTVDRIDCVNYAARRAASAPDAPAKSD